MVVAVTSFCASAGRYSQKRIATDRIEFAENIVDQEQRRRALLRHEDSGLRDLQRQRHRSLLAFRGILVRRLRLDEKSNIIAMRAHDGLAKTQFLSAGIREISREIVRCSRRRTRAARLSPVPLISRCAAAASGASRSTSSARIADNFAPCSSKRRIIGGELARPRMGRFQKRVAGAQSAFVGAQSWPVERVDLRARKSRYRRRVSEPPRTSSMSVLAKRNDAAQARRYSSSGRCST